MKKILFIFVILLATPCWGANKYINLAATEGTGSGDDWTNAYTSFSGFTWTRGNTYYVAGGEYTGDVTIPSTAGTSTITIKKANAADNSGVAGWSASFASTQAVIIGRMSIDTGYIEIDGVTGSGPGTTTYGIKIAPTNATNYTILATDETNHHLQYLEIRGDNRVGTHYGPYYTGTTKKLIRINNCWIHDTGNNAITVNNVIGTNYTDDYGMLIENNWLTEIGSPIIDMQGIQISFNGDDDYTIIRYNQFRNVRGTAQITFMGANTPEDANHSNSRIYDNIFYRAGTPISDQCDGLDDPWGCCTDLGTGTCDSNSPGAIVTLDSGTGEKTVNNIYIYNNTFYDLYRGGLYAGTSTSNIELKNNLFIGSYFPFNYNTGATSTSNNGAYDNTGAGAPMATEANSPLTNGAAYDFTLARNTTQAGLDLSSIFTTDIAGTTRTSWDVGAYEFGGTPPAATATATGVFISGGVSIR